jgi:phospholipid transport system transporter-binding protein
MMDGDEALAPVAEGFVADADGTRWTFVGALTFANAAAVCAAAAALALPTRGVVDCSGLAAVDSSAVAVLLSLKRRAAQEGSALAFDNVPAALSALATVYGVEEMLIAEEPYAST